MIDATLIDRCLSEVADLSRFFEDWFAGATSCEPATFARLPEVLSEDFLLVTTRGEVLDRDSLLARIRAAHGMASAANGRLEVLVESMRARCVAPDVCVVTYEERQVLGGESVGRIVTALFRGRSGAPNGVEWLHLHEVEQA